MKKINLLFVSIIIFTLISCSKEEKVPIDDSIYFDNDADCIENVSGNCCDVDGRILVIPDNSYVYNYNGKNNGVENISDIEWKIISGSIFIISGQNTNKVTLKFGPDFTSGIIKASSLVNNAFCENSLTISKL